MYTPFIKQLYVKVGTVNNELYLWQMRNKAVPSNLAWDWINCRVS